MPNKTLIPAVLALLLAACGQSPAPRGGNADPKREPPQQNNPAPQPVHSGVFTGQWTWTIQREGLASQHGRITWMSSTPAGERGFRSNGTRLDCTNAEQASTCTANGTAELVYDGESLELTMTYTEQDGSEVHYQGQDDDGRLSRQDGRYLLEGSGSVVSGAFGQSADFTLSGPR